MKPFHPPPPQVNGIDLRVATHDEAINVLRQTPPRVRLAVYRDEAQYREEDMWDSFSLELHKKPGQGLGLSIVGRRYRNIHTRTHTRAYVTHAGTRICATKRLE